MPATEHDNDNLHPFFTEDHDQHAHYIGTTEPDYLDLGHGGPVERLYAYRGDWYAVHTH